MFGLGITRKYFLIHIFCISLFVTSACRILSSNPTNDLEDQITFYYQTGPDLDKNEYLSVWIKNETNNCIIFPPDFGVIIYADTANGIVEVPNLMKVVGMCQ